jgi:hypothetical protein
MDHLIALPGVVLGRTDAPNVFWMISAEFGRRPDDPRNVALPGAALVAMSDKVAHIVDFLAVVGQEDDESILILHAPDNRIDNVVIIEYRIVILCPNLTGCSIIPDAARLIRRRKARKRSGLTLPMPKGRGFLVRRPLRRLRGIGVLQGLSS